MLQQLEVLKECRILETMEEELFDVVVISFEIVIRCLGYVRESILLLLAIQDDP